MVLRLLRVLLLLFRSLRAELVLYIFESLLGSLGAWLWWLVDLVDWVDWLISSLRLVM